MDYIDRYIYAVTRRLPEKQRGDINKELKTLIDDMIEENDEPMPYDEKVKKVLIELGDPEILANNYRGSVRYLIGPKFYDTYLLILRIVLFSVFIGITVATMVQSIFSKDQNGVHIASNYIAALFNGGFQAFAWVTIAFIITEKSSVNTSKIHSDKDSMEKSKWSPSQLPVIPEKKAVIPIYEPIISIILSTVFLALFYTTPQVFAAFFKVGNEIKVIPVFNQQAIGNFNIIILSVLLLCVLKEALKLYSRRWTLKLSLAVSVFSGLSTILILFVFASNVWNPDFSTEIMKNMTLSFDFVSTWSNIKNGFFVFIIVIGVIDIIATLSKGIRYNSAK